MGRTVETPADATAICYLDVSDICEDNPWGWEDFIADLEYGLMRRYPSLTVPKKEEWLPYPHRETRVILESDRARVTLSEYMGLAAISYCPLNPNDTRVPSTKSWRARVTNASGRGSLRRVATFSNGESLYQRI